MALLIGGTALGIMGAVLAVPTAAILQVIVGAPGRARPCQPTTGNPRLTRA
jgi:predicted PurR-regulated permease PerM